MAFPIPSLAEMRALVLAVGKAVFPGRNFANLKSYLARRATFLAAAVTQLSSQIKAIEDDVMPDTASDDGKIDRWGRILGVERKVATPARGASVGLVLGAAATPVVAGEELIHQSSRLRYKIATSTTVPGAESVLVDIEAIDTGSQTKLDRGQVLEFVSTPVGLQTRVVLQADLDDDGLDDEPFGAYRRRVLEQFSEPTAGGNDADYVEWLLELDEVTRAYPYTNRAGLGTQDLLALKTGTGTARKLDAGEEAAALAYVRTKAPGQIAGTGGALRHLTAVIDEEDVEIVLEPNGESAYAFHWIGGPLTVLAYTALTRLVQFNADRPASMKAGHRVSFKGVATNQDGTEYVIEALSGADAVILEAATEVDLAATDLAYSGGPLVTPIRDAIVAHMNGETVYAGRNRLPTPESSLESTVGLEVLVDGLGPANPGGIYGTWNGSLLRSVLGQIATYKAGVRNYSIPTPAADVEPTEYAFPLDNQIGLIAPRRVLVRGAT